MSVHLVHPAASALKLLNEHCPRCQEHTLGTLDPEHLRAACGIDPDYLREFLREYPQLHYEVMSIKAIMVQRDLNDRLPPDQARERYAAVLALPENT